mmetsp:Transcript_17614/g.27567  ORF Transcript_17614/g.27567 Transcript_17614/m.27567 type:complete len:256 (-) Transcript_17614:169-936(-)
MFLWTTLSADIEGLSRFDRMLVPPQTLLELLFGGFAQTAKLKDDNGDFHNIETLSAVTMEGDEVECLDLFLDKHGGALLIEYIPGSVRRLDCAYNSFHGSLTLEHLPAGVRVARFSVNSFDGSLNLDDLPPLIQFLGVDSNKLSGSISLKNLPDSLRMLNLSENMLSGQIDARSIKRDIGVQGKAMEEFFYDLWNPESVEVESDAANIWIDFSKNSFSGDVLVRSLSLVTDHRGLQKLQCTEIRDIDGNVQEILL